MYTSIMAPKLLIFVCGVHKCRAERIVSSQSQPYVCKISKCKTIGGRERRRKEEGLEKNEKEKTRTPINARCCFIIHKNSALPKLPNLNFPSAVLNQPYSKLDLPLF
jgi:hypothetical protein